MSLSRRAELACATNVQSLKVALALAESRVKAGEQIGWPAISQSWQQDVDLIQARLSAVQLERYAA